MSVLHRIRSYPLFLYFMLAYLISWFFMVPLALAKQDFIEWPLGFSAHYLAAYGPVLSAVLVSALTSGKEGLRKLLGGMIYWKVRPVWWIIAVSPVILYFLMSALNYFLTGFFYNIKLLGEIKFFPNYGFWTLLLWILTYGLGEEVGWRGFALPRLQKNRSALSATIILWIFWSIWHIPAFFYLYESSILIPFLIGQFAGAIFFTWLFNSTAGSTLMVIIFHGTFNFITASKGGEGTVAAVLSSLIVIWSVTVIFLFKPSDLSHLKRQAA